MTFDLVTNNGRLIVACPGDVLFSNAEEFEMALHNALETGNKTIIIDFSNASIIDSAGISAIVSNISLLKTKQGKLVLAGCNPTISKVFQLIGFHQHFTITTTLDEALKLQA